MRKVPNKKLNHMDLTAILETQNFARRNLEYPNEITALSTFKRKDGMTFYICKTGSPLFKPGYVVTARFRDIRMTLAPISGATSDKDVDLILDMIRIKNRVPNFQEVKDKMQAAGKITKSDIY